MKEDIEYLIKIDLRPWSRIDGKLPETTAYLSLLALVAATRTLLRDSTADALTKYYIIIPLLALPIVVSNYAKKQRSEQIAKFLTDSVYMAILSCFIMLVFVLLFQNQVYALAADFPRGKTFIYALISLICCGAAYAYGVGLTMRKIAGERARYHADYGGHKRERGTLWLIIASQIVVTNAIVSVLVVLN